MIPSHINRYILIYQEVPHAQYHHGVYQNLPYFYAPEIFNQNKNQKMKNNFADFYFIKFLRIKWIYDCF